MITIETIDSRISKAVVTSTLSALALAGCSGNSHAHSEGKSPVPLPQLSQYSPYPGVLHCTAELPSQWRPVPPNFNSPAAAQILKVTPEQVAHGKWGGAACEEAITTQQVNVTTAIVKGIGNKCIAFGVGSPNGKLEPGVKYHKILAACAADTLLPSPTTTNAAFTQDYNRYGNYINEVSNLRSEIATGATNDALDGIIADGCFDVANGPRVTNVYGNPAEDTMSAATEQQQHAYRAFLTTTYAKLRASYHAGFTSPDMHDVTQPTFAAEMNGCPPNAWDYRSDVAYAISQVLPTHPEG